MLKLNASVHSWLTRQERRLQNALVEQQLKEAAAKVSNELLEEKDELESEQKEQAMLQQLQEQTVDTTTTTTKSTSTTATTMITVTDSNGNQVESHITTTTAPVVNTVVVGTTSCSAGVQTTAASLQSTTASCSSSSGSSEKSWDLQSLITSETEFHKHLKDEVSDMYTAWDEADAR